MSKSNPKVSKSNPKVSKSNPMILENNLNVSKVILRLLELIKPLGPGVCFSKSCDCYACFRNAKVMLKGYFFGA